MGFFHPPVGAFAWADLTWRLAQFILGVAVCGFYAPYLAAAHAADKYSDSKWTYATVVGAFSAFSAFVYICLSLTSDHYAVALMWAWDVVLMLLWLVCFIIFGAMYMGENAEGDGGIEKMKTAMRVDGANLAFWTISAAVGGCLYYGVRMRDRSLHGGSQKKFGTMVNDLVARVRGGGNGGDYRFGARNQRDGGAGAFERSQRAASRHGHDGGLRHRDDYPELQQTGHSPKNPGYDTSESETTRIESSELRGSRRPSYLQS